MTGDPVVFAGLLPIIATQMGELVTELKRPEVVTEMLGSGGDNNNWLVVWNMHFIFHILGISSSQLTNSMIFQRGRAQPPTRGYPI